MQIRVDMHGDTQLVMHNARLSDPLDEFVKAIAAITAKKKKTDDDRLEMGRLEFYGGLYASERPGGGIVMPTPCLKRCFTKAAVLRREGKAVERALITTQLEWPLIYEGPTDPAALWADKAYVFRTSVRVGASRVQRTRPRFPVWAVSSEWRLETDILDLENFERIVEEAGLIEGLCDHRNQGSGRFKAKVTVLP